MDKKSPSFSVPPIKGTVTGLSKYSSQFARIKEQRAAEFEEWSESAEFLAARSAEADQKVAIEEENCKVVIEEKLRKTKNLLPQNHDNGNDTKDTAVVSTAQDQFCNVILKPARLQFYEEMAAARRIFHVRIEKLRREAQLEIDFSVDTLRNRLQEILMISVQKMREGATLKTVRRWVEMEENRAIEDCQYAIAGEFVRDNFLTHVEAVKVDYESEVNMAVANFVELMWRNVEYFLREMDQVAGVGKNVAIIREGRSSLKQQKQRSRSKMPEVELISVRKLYGNRSILDDREENGDKGARGTKRLGNLQGKMSKLANTMKQLNGRWTFTLH